MKFSKKLILTFSLITFLAIAFSGAAYSAQEGEKIVVSEELIKLNDLYKEGVITEEEFSKAKSILLNPDSDTSKIKKKKKKKKKLTAVERRQLKEAEEDELKALKKQLREEKRAEKEAILAEKNKIIEERKKACADKPKSDECKTAKASVKNILEKIKLFGQDVLETDKNRGKKKNKLLRKEEKE